MSISRAGAKASLFLKLPRGCQGEGKFGNHAVDGTGEGKGTLAFLPVDEALQGLVFSVATLLDNVSSAIGPAGNTLGQSVKLLNSPGF